VSAPVVEEILGRFAAASNATLLGRIGDRRVVYKPIAGVRPLWDFEAATLADREVLAREIAEALGFPGLVPPIRFGTGPLGVGTIQDFVDADPAFDPIPLIRSGDRSLWPVALLDLVIDNADRKAGHILGDRDGTLRSIDHGLCLHRDPKLRTILWGFAGIPFPAAMVGALDRLAEHLAPILEAVTDRLGAPEADALAGRVARFRAEPLHPGPPDDRPAIPWPPV
jgi:uncharacterized repeat protein (TIGR03843 family)